MIGVGSLVGLVEVFERVLEIRMDYPSRNVRAQLSAKRSILLAVQIAGGLVVEVSCLPVRVP
jgi:hypothetical protein